MQLLIFLSLIASICFSASFADPLQFGQVYNLTFPDGVDILYYEIAVPAFNPLLPPALQTIIITYLPLNTINVTASYTNPTPNITNADYIGIDKDGSYLRGIVWVPQENQTTLYISAAKFDNMTGDIFGLNVELPTSIISFPVGLRYETVAPIQPWQTKWFLVNMNEDNLQQTAVRAEFCDEPAGEVSMSIVFPETNAFSENDAVNPCQCDSVIVEDRSNNLLSRFGTSASQTFVLPPNNQPVYVGVFYTGNDPEPNLVGSQRSCPTAARRRFATSASAASSQFSARVTLWGQELFPAVRTKLTKPNKVNSDLIANVDDTAFCDYWTSPNFTAYISETEYVSWDSACFLEKYASNFTVYNPDILVGDGVADRVLIIQDFYNRKENNGTYFNIVHLNDDCGSFAYYVNEVPTEGWALETKTAWNPWAIGVTVILAFFLIVFFISSLLLLSRLRDSGRYKQIP